LNALASTTVPQNCPDELRYEPRVISGFRPVAEPHLALYFGVLQHMVAEQNRNPGGSYCLLADWHATTMWSSGPQLQQATLTTAAALLALGINPYKTQLFAQSHVTGLGDMAWLLSCMTPESLLLRNPVPQGAALKKNNIGAILYPVLMAADVLSLRGTKIVVPRDQVPNSRKVRQIANAANRMLGLRLFPVPVAVVRGGDTPGIDRSRMDVSRGNHVPMFLNLRELRLRVRQIQTDLRGLREPKDPSTCTVFRLYSLVASASEVEGMEIRYRKGQIGYEEAKHLLATAIAVRFSQAAEVFEDWRKRPDDIRDILRNGARVVSTEVCATLALVRDRLGLAL
jgi:tryptophanyl-tRNA synthetase